MFVQSYKKDVWERFETGLIEILYISPNINLREIGIHFHKLNIDKDARIAKFNNNTYVLYYKVTKKKYKFSKKSNTPISDIPILLNLDTGESRIIFDIQIKHKGAIIDIKTAQIFNSQTFGMNIPNI